jgi:hypothetical protein
MWKKEEIKITPHEPSVQFRSIKRNPTTVTQKVVKKQVPVFKQINSIAQKKIKRKTKTIDPQNAENKLKLANKLEIVD